MSYYLFVLLLGAIVGLIFSIVRKKKWIILISVAVIVLIAVFIVMLGFALDTM